MEYDAVLGADFIWSYMTTFNKKTNCVQFKNTNFRLYPYKRVILGPRSETIVKATTNRNRIGITKPEEIIPGIFIGCCLVKPKDNTCPITIINVTEEEKIIQIPEVALEEVKIREHITQQSVNAVQINNKIKSISREEQVGELIRTEHLNKEERKTLLELCREYNDVFHLEGETLTHTTKIEHEITTRIDSAPVNIRPYRLPERHKNEVDRQIKEMLKQEIIRPSMSQWNAPLLVVPKKTDAAGKTKLRIVVDFRKLNDLTIGDSFPLPNITDILDQLGNAKYFTTLDLASGYHQIPVAETHKNKTAFSTRTL